MMRAAEGSNGIRRRGPRIPSKPIRTPADPRTRRAAERATKSRRRRLPVTFLTERLPGALNLDVHRKRKLLAAICHILLEQSAVHTKQNSTVTGKGNRAPSAPAYPQMPKRLRETLQRLLLGDSEKQVAAHLGVSRHTVHVYVKTLYKRFSVSSRGELLAQFIKGAAALPAATGGNRKPTQSAPLLREPP